LMEGRPAHQVIRFQEIAPINAEKITLALTTPGATMPVQIVSATCSPKNKKAMKLKNAAQNTAARGGNTRVDTIVAIELAASCKPFKKSKARATAMRANRRPRPVTSIVATSARRRLDVVDY